MLTAKSIFIGGVIIALWGGCGRPVDNRLPESNDLEHYDQKIEALEKKVGTLGETSEYHTDDFRLTHDTVRRTEQYLATLSENINATRAEHLPEWQQMFDALTNREAMIDPDFKIGDPAFSTNFYLQGEEIRANQARLGQSEGRIEEMATSMQTNAASIADHEGRLNTLDGTVAHINKAIEAKFDALDKIIADYDGRIKAVEDRMVAVETRVGVVESKVGGFDSRIKALEQILRQFNIAAMDRRLRSAEATLVNHEGFITDLQTNLGIVTGEVNTLKDDLKETQSDLTRTSNDLRQLISAHSHGP